MTRVKICGCTSYDDAALAVDCGADAVGFIFAPSERRIEIERAAEIAARLWPFAVPVGVFVDAGEALVRRALAAIPGLRLQFSGDEPPAACEALAPAGYFKAFRLGAQRDDREILAACASYPRAVPLFDAWDPVKRGGTGKPFPWDRLAAGGKPASFVVSGGLTPENVGACVRLLRPAGVDVRSGVETDGRKDPEKVRAFVRAVREADA